MVLPWHAAFCSADLSMSGTSHLADTAPCIGPYLYPLGLEHPAFVVTVVQIGYHANLVCSYALYEHTICSLL